MAQRLDQPAPPELRTDLGRFIDTIGQARAVAALGVSRQAIDRALSGRPCRRGTVVAIQVGLAAAGARP